MNILASLSIGVVTGRIRNKNEEEKRQKNYAVKRRRSLVRRVYQRERKQRNLDYTIRPSPLKEYIFLSYWVNELVQSIYFRSYIFICIILAAILVGIESYSLYTDNYYIIIIDTFVIYSFLFEVILKIISEGTGPYLYFIGPEWEWNIFDFSVTIISLILIGTSQIKVLRLLRFARIAKVLGNLPEIQMIIHGLRDGIIYNVHIFLLLAVTFYIFGIIGVVLFQDNDPWHFGTIYIAMFTLLRIATMETWGDVLYINYYGCDQYPISYYTTNSTQSSTALGGVYYCNQPQAQPIASALYFISFIMLSAFCILALFIAAISMHMAESMYEANKKKEDRRVSLEMKRLSELLTAYRNPSLRNRIMNRQKKLITLAFAGLDLNYDKDLHPDCGQPTIFYQWLGKQCREVLRSPFYTYFMATIIIGLSITIGLETENYYHNNNTFLYIYDLYNNITQYIFLMEFIIKLISEEFQPWRYFYDNWNILDAVILIVVFVPSDSNNALATLRLLRLLRILKIIRIFKTLQVIIIAFVRGLSGILVVSCILFLSLYFFGLLGVFLFSTNDVWHFGQLHTTMYILLNAATLDNWATSLAYINIYGCEQYPGAFPELCTTSQPQYIIGSLYFIIFIFLCSFIILTLFIGVVNINMEKARYEENEKIKVENRAFRIAEFDQLNRSTVMLYKEVFDAINFTKSRRIGRIELKFGLEIAELHLNTEHFEKLYDKVDVDKNTYGIDFSEFLKFLLDVRDQALSHNANTHISERTEFVTKLHDSQQHEKEIQQKKLKKKQLFMKFITTHRITTSTNECKIVPIHTTYSSEKYKHYDNDYDNACDGERSLNSKYRDDNNDRIQCTTYPHTQQQQQQLQLQQYIKKEVGNTLDHSQNNEEMKEALNNTTNTTTTTIQTTNHNNNNTNTSTSNKYVINIQSESSLSHTQQENHILSSHSHDSKHSHNSSTYSSRYKNKDYKQEDLLDVSYNSNKSYHERYIKKVERDTESTQLLLQKQSRNILDTILNGNEENSSRSQRWMTSSNKQQDIDNNTSISKKYSSKNKKSSPNSPQDGDSSVNPFILNSTESDIHVYNKNNNSGSSNPPLIESSTSSNTPLISPLQQPLSHTTSSNDDIAAIHSLSSHISTNVTMKSHHPSHNHTNHSHIHSPNMTPRDQIFAEATTHHHTSEPTFLVSFPNIPFLNVSNSNLSHQNSLSKLSKNTYAHTHTYTHHSHRHQDTGTSTIHSNSNSMHIMTPNELSQAVSEIESHRYLSHNHTQQYTSSLLHSNVLKAQLFEGAHSLHTLPTTIFKLPTFHDYTHRRHNTHHGSHHGHVIDHDNIHNNHDMQSSEYLGNTDYTMIHSLDTIQESGKDILLISNHKESNVSPLNAIRVETPNKILPNGGSDHMATMMNSTIYNIHIPPPTLFYESPEVELSPKKAERIKDIPQSIIISAVSNSTRIENNTLLLDIPLDTQRSDITNMTYTDRNSRVSDDITRYLTASTPMEINHNPPNNLKSLANKDMNIQDKLTSTSLLPNSELTLVSLSSEPTPLNDTNIPNKVQTEMISDRSNTTTLSGGGLSRIKLQPLTNVPTPYQNIKMKNITNVTTTTDSSKP